MPCCSLIAATLPCSFGGFGPSLREVLLLLPPPRPPRLVGRSPHADSQADVLESCAARWRAYLASDLDLRVDPCDDMLVDTPEGWEHYRLVGLKALELLADAMVLAGRPRPGRILDLPCGGGRVTRHLVRFFPEAEISVADVDEGKVEAVTRQFAVRRVAASADFTAPLGGTFDLIFVGSLVTHFDEALYVRALDVLLGALAPGGVLVLTTTGRSWAAEAQRRDVAAGLPARAWWSPAATWLSRGRYRASGPRSAIEGRYARRGFGYVQVNSWTRLYGRSYGSSWASPSWLMRQVEHRSDIRILGFKERGFDQLLDALLLQRLA